MEEESQRPGLLKRLAIQLGAAVHRRALVLAAGDVLHQELGAAALELTLPTPHDATAFVSWLWQPQAPLVERLVPPAEAAAIKGELKARRSQRRWQIDTPVPLAGERLGKLSLVFPDSGGPPALVSEPELLLAIGAIVGTACRGCDLVAKVASLSRRAHRDKRELQQRLSKLGNSERPIVAVSRAMREVLEQIELVAPHPTAVLIRGESGTGKELLARHLHASSVRAAEPFVAINCAALPESLIESELFGHEKGAFTGAGERHVGRFERAQGGTLFLDEIGELPPSVQGKLLRALQERVIERVGGREPVAVDVRIVAATHRSLEDMLTDGRFRADLFYRLNVFPVSVPALRERPEDIAELARAKLRRMCTQLGREVPELSPRQLRALCSEPWPGNVRELENHLERALILSTGQAFVLPAASTRPTRRAATAPSAAAGKLTDVVKQTIVAALERSGGKIYGANGAAAALGMKPSTLQSKMLKLGVTRLGGNRQDAMAPGSKN